MNILWISYYGSWTEPLLHRIAQMSTGRMGIIVPSSEQPYSQKNQNGVSIFTLPVSKAESLKKMSTSLFAKYNRIIQEFQPDIIHIHGTEKNLAQIQNFIKDVPIVISIQGLLSAYEPYTFNYMNKRKVFRYRTLKNILYRGGVNSMHKVCLKGSIHEKDILRNGTYFIGRTYWDKAHILFHNPQAYYFQGEELLRNSFYHKANTWSVATCKKHSVFMPSGFNPIKGLHWAIETVQLLKTFYPDITLSVPGLPPNLLNSHPFIDRIVGEEYMIYIKKKIKAYHLEQHINILPKLTADEMAQNMKNAHIFLSPSSIDNSPNAVGEAMMIGVPVVTTPVGGVPSIWKDEESCLFAPAGDPYMMAFQIKRIFDDTELAQRIGAHGHQIALKRHHREGTVNQYMENYRQIINLHQKKK